MTADLAAIVAFIEARLAEDEAAAKEAPWELDRGEWPFWIEYIDSSDAESAGTYRDRFPPARMLRDVEAARRILERHHADEHGMCAGCPVDTAGDPDYPVGECPEIRDLASRWSDHPEYQEGWKP